MASYEKTRQLCSSCVSCSLHKTRTQVVFGTGSVPSKIMFIGRDPGAQEDYQGEPFIGKAGQRLGKALKKAGINRKQIYITNLNKCHSENNIGPTEEQRQACFNWLEREFEFVKPKFIFLFGREVSEFIIGKIGPITKIHGKKFKDEENDVYFIPMLHPSYLIRNLNNLELQESFDEVFIRYARKIF